MRKKFKQPPFIQKPTRLMTDKRLTRFDCDLYGYILSLSNLKNGCRVSNQTLAQLMLTKNAGSVGNSLTRLQKCGYIHRDFSDQRRRRRQIIIPLVDAKGVSLSNGTVSLHDDRGPSSANEQSYNSPIRNNSEGETGPHTASVFETGQPQKQPCDDPLAEGLVKHLCEVTGMNRPDRAWEWNVAQARELIKLFMERLETDEEDAVDWAECLIDKVSKPEIDYRGFDNINLTHMGYLVNNFNRLINEYGPHRDEDGSWYFL